MSQPAGSEGKSRRNVLEPTNRGMGLRAGQDTSSIIHHGHHVIGRGLGVDCLVA